jgi:hypothetical protein
MPFLEDFLNNRFKNDKLAIQFGGGENDCSCSDCYSNPTDSTSTDSTSTDSTSTDSTSTDSTSTDSNNQQIGGKAIKKRQTILNKNKAYIKLTENYYEEIINARKNNEKLEKKLSKLDAEIITLRNKILKI